MTASELGMHSASGDCYMAIDGTVYDTPLHIHSHTLHSRTETFYSIATEFAPPCLDDTIFPFADLI